MTSHPTTFPLDAARERYPDALAIEDGDRRWTYREFHRQVDRLCQWLGERDWPPASRVCLQLANTSDAAVLFWTLLRFGMAACPIHTQLPPNAASALAIRMRAAALLRQTDVAAIVAPTTGLQATSFDNVQPPDSGTTVVFTSGSTASPKAVVHPWHAHYASASGANQNIPLAPEDRWLWSLPICHVAGIAILFRCALAGATVVCPSPDRSLPQMIDQLAIQHVSVVAAQLKGLVQAHRREARQLKTVLLGGGPAPPSLVHQACEQGLPVIHTYGLSEMASQVTATSYDTPEGKRHTAGRVLPLRQLCIAADGQILVRGETLFAGYDQDGPLVRPLTPEGWFATGDQGNLDDQGYLTVTGRRDHMFISGGENIYPEEIESLLMDLPCVRRAIVVPVADQRFGQRPAAFVDACEFAVDLWREALAQHLPRFKIPVHFWPWPADLPEGVKPSRTELTRRASQLSG